MIRLCFHFQLFLHEWNLNARRLKEITLYLEAIWLSLSMCALSNQKICQSRYKYEVRRLLHHKQFIRRAKMAAAIASSDPKLAHLVLIIFHNFFLQNYTTFWTHKIMVVTHCMFTSLYASLKAADLNDLFVSEECVDCAFAHLKCGKSDSTSTLSDQLINALPALRRPLAPRHLLPSSDMINVQITQKLHSCSHPQGFHFWQLSSHFCRTNFEQSSGMVYSFNLPQTLPNIRTAIWFQSKISSTLCTGTLKNVVAKYMHEGTSVFARFLLASKAFDLVTHEILFISWLERGFPVL